MSRGTIAKENITNKIKEAFGTEYVGVFDKKIILQVDDGGEQVQIALMMTCPKTFVGAQTAAVEVPDVSSPVEITQNEKDNIQALLDKLGL